MGGGIKKSYRHNKPWKETDRTESGESIAQEREARATDC